MNKWIRAFLGLGIFSSLVSAQKPPADSILTWRDCIAIANEKNPDLASARLEVDASQSAYAETKNGLYPQLILDHGYRVPGNTSNGSNWQTRALANVKLWDKSETANEKTAGTLISQAQANQSQTASLLRYNLRKAFAQLLFIQKTSEVSRRITAMREEEAQLVALRYNAGRESKGNMLRAKAQLLEAQADLAQSLRQRRIQQQNLNRQMGQDAFIPFLIKDSLSLPSPAALPADEKPLVDNRPDIAQQQAVVRTAEASLDAARGNYWPTLTAGYTQFLDGYTALQNSWNVVLTYPLFGKGPTSARYAMRTAQTKLEKTKQDLRSARAQALVDVETAWSEFASACDQAKVQAALLEAARQRNEEANVRYNSGLLTYDNWEIIASDRISLERQTIQAQLNVIVAEASWQRALGKPLAE